MQSGAPSKTALRAAILRAVHQQLEAGRVFADPLAVAILGADCAQLRDPAHTSPERRAMRLFIAARSRFAEDALAQAVEAGVEQLVILGAGLDTFAYRSPLARRLRIFEVDHPATQAWKHQQLTAAGIAAPPGLCYVSIDFERERLPARLSQAGFAPERKSFFTWLGVVPYLTDAAVFDTLGYIAALSGGSHVVFDYANPPSARAPELQAIHARRAAYVAALGEAWLSYYDSAELAARLRALGFEQIEDLGPHGIARRYVPERAASAPSEGGHLLHATTTRPPDTESR